MIEIDGSEGGGQIVRTALAMSTLTGNPVKIKNIRGSRPNPGLKTQHMMGIKALAELCEAKIKGLEIGSKEIEFSPGKLEAKDLEVKISTAGSIGLVLQILMIPTSFLKKEIKITINGGATFGKWAPPVLYLQKVFFQLLDEKSEIKILRDGFFPKGGAKVEVLAKPLKLKEINITEKGKLLEIKGVSVASSLLKKAKVAERQAESAKKLIIEKLKISPEIEIKYADSICAGSGIQLWAKTQNSIIGGECLGERGKPAEEVGKEAAENLIFEYENGAVDSHAADMLLPYLALSKAGRIKTSKITQHIKTNAFVIEKFLPVKFEINEKEKTISVRVI